ncbi:MAG: hypothetical protein H0W70_05195 [Actinobacteria bacterium]|nr:hypothetical protein [Actinomycetota bacterium]
MARAGAVPAKTGSASVVVVSSDVVVVSAMVVIVVLLASRAVRDADAGRPL